MSQFYSNPDREDDPHALPDCEVFELTAHEVAASDSYEEERWEFMKRPEFRLAAWNQRSRDAVLDAMVEELGITGGQGALTRESARVNLNQQEQTTMSKARFSVTYEIVTEQSAQDGDAAERGFIGQALSLRQALKYVSSTRTSACDGVESVETDSSPCTRPRWITVRNAMEFETGAYESRALHIPDAVSAASARRIARMVGVPAHYLRGHTS